MTKIMQHPNKKDFFQVEKAVLIYNDYPKTKPELKELHRSTNKPIAVLGAGMNLPEDLKELPDDCILISCNHHAFRLVDPDYMLFLDSPDRYSAKEEFIEYAKKKKSPEAIRISYKELDYTDYYCINELPLDLERIGDTGIFAMWIACYITTGPVYLCGMNLRQKGEPEHFYDSGNHEIIGGAPVNMKLKKWQKVVDLCENAKRIRAFQDH